MDFELNEDQQAIIEAIERLLEQNAGPARAIELNKRGAYDLELHQTLEASGFSQIVDDMADDGKPAILEAVLMLIFTVILLVQVRPKKKKFGVRIIHLGQPYMK